MSRLWRVGRSLGRTLYWQVGAEPSKADVFVGIMDTVGLARQVVAAMNERADEREQVAGWGEWEAGIAFAVAQLRAQVESLTVWDPNPSHAVTPGQAFVPRQAVLDLLDGGSE